LFLSDLAATPQSVLALLRYSMACVEKLDAEIAWLKGGKATASNSAKPPSSARQAAT
jgi:hypothetical protein